MKNKYRPFPSFFAVDSISVLSARNLTEHFVDPVTGDPLGLGYIETFVDSMRQKKIPLYHKVAGTLPNTYEFKELPNPCYLTPGGVIGDEKGTPVIPYYLKSDESNRAIRYFICIYDKDGAKRYEIEDFPDSPGDGAGGSNGLRNMLVNGDYFLHTSLPDRTLHQKNQLVSNKTPIAYGGWSLIFDGDLSEGFEYYEFLRQTSTLFAGKAPTRYKLRVYTSSLSSKITAKKVFVEHLNVLSLSPNPTTYTLSLTLSSMLGNISIPIYVSRNYGSDSGRVINDLIATAQVTSTETVFSFTYSLADTSESIILGSKDDDYWAIYLALPLTSQYDIHISNVQLYEGESIILPWHISDYATSSSLALFSGLSLPPADNSDVGLNLGLTATGIKADQALVGSLLYTYREPPIPGYLLMEGDKSLFTDGYSDEGIPYKRLHKVLAELSGVENLAVAGTGLEYLNVYVHEKANCIRLTSNKPEYRLVIIDGAPATGFEIFQSAINSVSNTRLVAFVAHQYQAAPKISMECIDRGTINRDKLVCSTDLELYDEYQSMNARAVLGMRVRGLLSPTSFFHLTNPTTATIQFLFYIGNPTPVPPADSVAINLIGGMDVADTFGPIVDAISSRSFGYLKIVKDAEHIEEGANFLFTVPAGTFIVWYSINGQGNLPLAAGIKIEVKLLGTDKAVDVQKKTAAAINRMMFQVPSSHGFIFRSMTQKVVSDYDIITNDDTKVLLAITPSDKLPKWAPGRIQFTDMLAASVAAKKNYFTYSNGKLEPVEISDSNGNKKSEENGLLTYEGKKYLLVEEEVPDSVSRELNVYLGAESRPYTIGVYVYMKY